MRGLLLAAALLLPAPPSAAAVPQRLNYQGKLANAAGDPLSGTYSFRFKLFSAETGGAALFSEDVTGAGNAVSVVNGIYSVQIGSYTAGGIPYGVFEGQDLYLEIDVNPGTDLTGAETLAPRERLNSAAWAVHALGAERLGAGTVIATFTAAGHLNVPSGVTSTSGTFTATGGTQHSIQTSSGISVGNTGGVTAAFFSGVHIGDGSRLTNLPTGTDTTRVAKAGDTMTGALTMSGATANILSGSSITTSGRFFGPLTGDVTGNVSGNAGTAAALAADPADCGAGAFANAIGASGALACSTNGSSLTSLNASNLASGAVPAVRVDLSTVTTALAGKQDADADLTDLADGSLTGSKVGAGVPAANIAGGSLGSTVIASSIAVGSVLDASIVSVSGSKVSGNISGNAATASALAANGANCAAGNAPLGVDAAGAAEGCYDVATQTELNNYGATASVRYLSSPDGDRVNHIAPNALVRNLQLDFKNASAVGGTGNYAGVLTYSPWDGTTASTGDPSYQVAFYSNVANGTLPRMRVRNGIDAAWNSWYDIWNASSDGSGSGLDADVVDGLNPTSAATGSTLMSRDANGDTNVRYLFSSYVNMSHAASGATADTVFYSSTDDYIRKNNATGFRASLNVPTRTGGDASGDWSINIAGNVIARSKSDAGAIASRSGFFETSVPVNYYPGASSWQHLIEARHTNDANNYAMQVAGSFFDQEFYARKTNNSATTAWSRLIRQDPSIGTAVGGTGAAAGAGAADLTANGTVFFGTGGSYKVTSAGAGTFATSAFGGLNPTADNVGNIGTTALRWTTAHAVNFYGAYNAGPDLAERYPASEPVEPGDLVLFDPDPPAHKTVLDQSKVVRVNEVGGKRVPVAVKKSSTPYQAGLLGVISTAPGVKLHDPDDESNPPVALIGRVPVKVCDENGPIKVGDRLTSSGRPGYAMRATSAGPAVAIALQAFDGKEGKILAFVQAGEANVSERLQALSRENALMKERLERLERLVSGGK